MKILLLIFFLALISKIVRGKSFIKEAEIPWDELEREVNKTCGWRESTLCSNRKSSNINNDIELAKCFCDKDCWKYGDCCFDAAKEAWESGKKMDHRWKCQNLPVKDAKMSYSIYMISFCPESWTDYSVEQKCTKNRTFSDYSYVMDLPVVSSTTNITYANVHCAICNKDTDFYKIELEIICPKTKPNCRDLLPTATYSKNLLWSTSRRPRDSTRIRAFVSHFNNKTHFLPSTNSRQCKKTADDCRFNTSFHKYCPLFAYYVDQFKNPFCAGCSGRKFKCSVIVIDGHTKKPEISFSLSLDFNEMHRENGGMKQLCSKGQVFDPIYNRCILLI